MVTKENVAIDSCVFFNMVWYNNKYHELGKEGFNSYMNSRISKLEKSRDHVYAQIPDSFKQGKTESKELVIELYLEQLRDEANKIRTARWEVYKKLEQTTDPKERAELEKAKQRIEELLPKKVRKYESFKKVYNEYSERSKRLEIGLIYKKFLDGEINLFVPKTSYKEILNHIRREGKRNYSLSLSDREAFSLLTKCYLINVGSKQGIEQISKLSKEFRTKNPNADKNVIPMKADINSVGVYGDSQIMAEANVAGMILITENAKDFITVGKHNSYEGKRKHIAWVCQNNEPYATDALAYTPREFLIGRYKKPEKKSVLSQSLRRSSERKSVKEELIL